MNKKREFFSNKRGSENLVIPVVIFIILNLMFAVIIMGYVFKSSTGALVYEQAYAKQIVLLVDSAKPVTQFSIDFTKGLEIAEANELNSEQISNLVKIRDNEVLVKLGKAGGYKFGYFSDYEIDSYFDGNFLIVNVNEKDKNIG